ncbi:uncharacterized protein LOC130957230 [Arachis stenosperma]|uniref:uncharacterized protein LOC130957230 n=1 Tax=Arachis stenosperma TaxID=217475 RepID=UPI0025AD4A6C|nr:uncharacterized protein LOC130957230 [Arachis stenosperma]
MAQTMEDTLEVSGQPPRFSTVASTGPHSLRTLESLSVTVTVAKELAISLMNTRPIGLLNSKAAGEKWLLQPNELDKFCLAAFENAKIYKETAKRWHGKKISSRVLEPGQKVLLFNSRLKLFPEKLKSRWKGP